VYCLEVYPRGKILDWLKKDLQKRREEIETRATPRPVPVVMFFHFNLHGPYSDWWTEEQKEDFYKIIEPHKDRIAFLAVGHLHSTYTATWKGIPQVNGSGTNLVKVDVSVNGNRTKETEKENEMKVDTTIIDV